MSTQTTIAILSIFNQIVSILNISLTLFLSLSLHMFINIFSVFLHSLSLCVNEWMNEWISYGKFLSDFWQVYVILQRQNEQNINNCFVFAICWLISLNVVEYDSFQHFSILEYTFSSEKFCSFPNNTNMAKGKFHSRASRRIWYYTLIIKYESTTYQTNRWVLSVDYQIA
jgi:hypothetical protein